MLEADHFSVWGCVGLVVFCVFWCFLLSLLLLFVCLLHSRFLRLKNLIVLVSKYGKWPQDRFSLFLLSLTHLCIAARNESF